MAKITQDEMLAKKENGDYKPEKKKKVKDIHCNGCGVLVGDNPEITFDKLHYCTYQCKVKYHYNGLDPRA